MEMNNEEFLDEKDFSIVLGGPFFQLLNRLRLSGKSLELVKKRTIIICMLAWLPLLILSLVNGQALGKNLNMPFINDYDVHIRFLIGLPLLIIAEMFVHQRLLPLIKEFRERNLISGTGITQFNNAMKSALRLRNSNFAELFIFVFIYVAGYKLVWQQSAAIGTSAWYSEPSVAGSNLSLAGIWFRFLSLPVFQFLILRWYYRCFIWARFLYQVSRINLNLVASHPDDVGGLGFLSNTVYAFMPLALAHGALTAGMISNHIFYDGASLLDYKLAIFLVVLVVSCLAVLPLFFFSSQLSIAKRTGSIEYGKLASRFVQEFDDTWVKGKGPVNNSMIGGDIQSLSDLSNSYNVVEKMQFVPINRNIIVVLILTTILPILPLVLTMMPIGELLKLLTGVLF